MSENITPDNEETVNNTDSDILQATMLMNELKDFCTLKKIPMFATVANVHESGTADYTTRVVTPLSVRKNIENEDKITKFNAAMSGAFRLEVKTRDSQIADIFDELDGAV